MDSHPEPKRIERVVLACAQCRTRHVKCDSTQPVCNRCRRDGKDCTYQKSRRGGLDKAALARRRLRLQQESERAQQKGTTDQERSEHGSHTSADSPLQDDSQIWFCTPAAIDTVHRLDPELARPGSLAFQISDDRLLELYFENFWPAFPFVLPIHFLRARRATSDHGMNHLLPVLYWIGSIYAPWTASEPYFETALASLSTPPLAHTPFNVQALMLYAIALYHVEVRQEARDKLNTAVTIAIELQMNGRHFAQAYGEGNPVLEESWRRTFYLLSATDQHFSVINNTPIFTLLTVPNGVDLPCEDEQFESGVRRTTLGF